MNTFFQWILSAVAIGIAALLVPGVEVTLLGTILVAVVLAFFSIFIKPLIVLLTLPINILTLGLFSLVINGGLIMLAGLIVPGFVVAGFWWALLYSIVLSIINLLFGLKVKSS
jgi:putative membrane protein